MTHSRRSVRLISTLLLAVAGCSKPQVNLTEFAGDDGDPESGQQGIDVDDTLGLWRFDGDGGLVWERVITVPEYEDGSRRGPSCSPSRSTAARPAGRRPSPNPRAR